MKALPLAWGVGGSAFSFSLRKNCKIGVFGMSMVSRLTVTARIILIVAASVALSSCTSAPQPGPQIPEKGAEAAIFYPPPPDFPRIQFLAKFSSPMDLSTQSQGFRDFVFGGATAEGRVVQKPYGLAMFQGQIFVVDVRGAGYGVFDVANASTRFFRPTGAGKLSRPIAIAVDSDGTRYIGDAGRNEVLVFDANERFVRAIGDGKGFRPADLAIAGELLYVTNGSSSNIVVFDKRSGKRLAYISESGAEPGQVFMPTGIAVGPDGSLWVADTTNFRVQRFSPDGEFIGAFGQAGDAPGSFARPKSVAVDRDGIVYVLDAAFNNVQLFTEDGQALMFFGDAGADEHAINMPASVRIDYENVDLFRKYADPNFDLEYLVIVTSQFGLNAVSVFGFGSLVDEDVWSEQNR